MMMNKVPKEYQSWRVLIDFSWRLLEGFTESDWGEQNLTEWLKFLQGRGGFWPDWINCLGDGVKDRLDPHRLAEQTKALSRVLTGGGF